MSANTMWKVTVAVMKIETREVCAASKQEAREIVRNDPTEEAGLTVLEVEWIDPEQGGAMIDLELGKELADLIAEGADLSYELDAAAWITEAIAEIERLRVTLAEVRRGVES